MTENIDNNSNKKSPKPLTGWNVFFIIFSMFAVVISVNVYFGYKAVTTSSGEIGHAYLSGLKFNETIAARAKQSELGWQMELGFERGAGGDALFIATLLDKDKKPVTGALLSGKVGRPVEAKDDQNLKFVEEKPGVYTAHITKLGPGKWHFYSQANKPNFPEFIAETDLSIR